jgi:nucleoside-diphosphate-sugar epimerase
MNIFVTGNLGYVGVSLCKYLRKKYPTAFLAGFDLGYFQHCLTTPASSPEHILNVQFYGDVRDMNEDLLSGFDHIIHLAAISNDPIGNKFEAVTLDVNYEATIRLAELALNKRVKSFVFASSCSVYGAGGKESKTELSEVKPLTAYAQSKVLAEEGLRRLNPGMITTCLRFATACGMTDRLRLDLVLNDFVASALTSRQINILSDGTPWRPLINVNDMCRAFDWAMTRSSENGGSFLICNTGSNDWNFTVSELAERVRGHFQDVQVTINESALPDKRSYRVNFDKFSCLAKQFRPVSTLDDTIRDLKKGLESIQFDDVNFRESKLMRLNVLNDFFTVGDLDHQLNWV